MTEAKCPVFGLCGGCRYQNIPYEKQLKSKKQRISSFIEMDDIEVFSGTPYSYRNRMDFSFNPKGLGFKKIGTWDTPVDIEKCPISTDHVNSILTELRSFFKGVDSFNFKTRCGTYKYALVRATDFGGSVSISLNRDSPHFMDACENVKQYAKESCCENVLVAYVNSQKDMSISEEVEILKGSDMMYENFSQKKFMYSIQGFFQNNSVVAQMLHYYVTKNIKNWGCSGGMLLDLFGGVGTFGILNSEFFSKILILESDIRSIDAAKQNIALNKADNVEAVVCDVKGVRDIPVDDELYVIVDPPRSGIHPKAVRSLRRMLPEKIFYISCNPDKLETDLIELREYEVSSCAVFDMFPQTPHVETAVELSLI